MDLYILPMSCSFTAHVACLEAGVTPRVHCVDAKTKLLGDGTDYRQISPLGIVPVISLPDGSHLSESVAVLQYIADSAPAAKLAPPAGTVERYRLMQWLNFITTELHKKLLWNVFSTKTTPALKAWAQETAAPTIAHVARGLEGRDFLVGDNFTVADIYMFWALLIAPHGGISLEAHPHLKAYVENIQARPSVRAVLSHDYPLFLKEKAA